MFATAHCTTLRTGTGVYRRHQSKRAADEVRAAVLRLISLVAYAAILGCAHTACARRPPITFLAFFTSVSVQQGRPRTLFRLGDRHTSFENGMRPYASFLPER